MINTGTCLSYLCNKLRLKKLVIYNSQINLKVFKLLIAYNYIMFLSRNDYTSTCESWGEGELLSVVLL
jgi:hypothetical protein